MKFFKEKYDNNYQNIAGFCGTIDKIFNDLSANEYDYKSTEELAAKVDALLELYKKLAKFMIKEEDQLKFLNSISYVEWEEK